MNLEPIEKMKRTSHNNGDNGTHDEVGTHDTHGADTNTGLGGTVPGLI